MIKDKVFYGLSFSYVYHGKEHNYKLVDFDHFNTLFSNLTFALAVIL